MTFYLQLQRMVIVDDAHRPAPVAACFESTEIASDLVGHALGTAFPERLTAGRAVQIWAFCASTSRRTS